MIRLLLWLGASSLLLAVGWAAVLCGLFFLGRATGVIEPAGRLTTQLALVLYFRVVFFKGLLPQLVLVIAGWPLAARRVPALEHGRPAMAGGLFLLGLAAYAIVAPLVLTVDYPSWPAMRMPTPLAHAGTAALSAAGVALAALLARALLRARPVAPPLDSD